MFLTKVEKLGAFWIRSQIHLSSNWEMFLVKALSPHKHFSNQKYISTLGKNVELFSSCMEEGTT